MKVVTEVYAEKTANKMNFKIRKLKAAAMLTCVLVAAGSFTYVNNSESSTVMAKTIADLEEEKAANDAEIAKLQKQINDIDDEIANEEYKQTIIQEKIEIQTANLDLINTKIDEINLKIDDTEKKIAQLEIDIDNKQKDIDVGMEEFKERLRAMYVSGNDSLASALVGSTDFYDMLSKMELISQVAKRDDELITSLKTQLEQFAEAQTQLDIAQKELNDDLDEQKNYKAEFTAMGSKFKVICECKQYKKSVDREKVVVLHKKVESIGAHKGILLSTSGFQSGAIQYARAHGIALIRMGDQKVEFYSHSNGKQECDEDDPFLYGERHMPPYFAIDCTFESDEPRRVYPTGTMIKKIYKEMNQLIKKKKGIDIDIPELEESAE